MKDTNQPSPSSKAVMNYFGTSLSEAGHYFWLLDGDKIKRSELWFRHIPFNPEEMPVRAKRKGEVQFFAKGEYSICAIEGSCADKRGGSKSVFFVKEPLLQSEMVERIKATPIAMRIIQQMPFTVDIFKS